MEIKDIVDAWKKGELSGDAAIHIGLYPATPDKEDIEWAIESQKKELKIQTRFDRSYRAKEV
jgi:hypothetical protein